jgi:AraC family transcriptional regulator
MSGFEVTIVDLAAKQLAGIKVRTSMAKAKQDCPALWQNFCPKMPDIFTKKSYGISVMLNEQDFDYWAAAEAPEGACPAGLEPVGIPAGSYARCEVANLESIGEGYMFMYQTWLASQGEWKLNVQAPCFELYSANWNPAMPFELFMPVMR